MKQPIHLRITLILFFTLAALSAGAQTQAPEGRYLLHPGDKIAIHYELTPENDQQISIQPDGYGSANLCGEVKLGGLTLPEASEALRSCVSARLVNPKVQISLAEFQMPYYVVAGEVNEPRRYEMRESITALQALMSAGGPKITAKRSQIILLLGAATGHPQVRLMDVKRLQNGAPENPVLSSGDIVYVPFNKIHSMQQIANLLAPFSNAAWSIDNVTP